MAFIAELATLKHLKAYVRTAEMNTTARTSAPKKVATQVFYLLLLESKELEGSICYCRIAQLRATSRYAHHGNKIRCRVRVQREFKGRAEHSMWMSSRLPFHETEDRDYSYSTTSHLTLGHRRFYFASSNTVDLDPMPPQEGRTP